MAAKKKTSRATTAKKKNVKNLSQTHGKVEKFEPTTLDQIWGDDGSSMYGTMDERTYEERLDDMNLSDLQTHASRVGIIPVDNRGMLKDRLMREFRKHVLGYKKPFSDETVGEKPVDKEIAKILSEGR
tara:strand:- start:63 stop:446 length:384 start_codon:yes stop_codon:yes gene_type:complete